MASLALNRLKKIETGNTMGARKSGVWISDVQINGENDRWQSLIILDVEGTDLRPIPGP